MRLPIYTLTAALLCAPLLNAAPDGRKAAQRLADSATLISEIMGTPDKAIPQDLFNKAACIVIVPGMKKAAFGVGGQYGAGFALCRAKGAGWGPPAAIRMEGGSLGFQIGVSSTDLIMLVMNERGMQRLTTDKFTIGADATAAAGPVGRNAGATTDAMMTAEILSWSRSKGAFIGISLNGATLRNDIDENEAMYGKRWTNKEILGSGVTPPAPARSLIQVLTKYSMRKTN